LDAASARAALAASGHSRAPVTGEGGLDEVIGVVHLRDLLDDDRPPTRTLRPAVVLPESLRVSDALQRFKAEHEQFAVVVDEHGGIEGIVTLEDLLEEVVGEIYDETDRDLIPVTRGEDGSVVLPGTFPVHDLVDLDIEPADMPEGNYTTIAGLVLAALGRLPKRPGDVVHVSGWDFAVTAIKRNAITRVRVSRAGERTGG
jgi:putative hemolysin